MSRIIIGVMGPGEGASDQHIHIAFQLGQQIAHQGWILLTGGRNSGVMQAASQGAHEAGGLTIGILPTPEESKRSPFVHIPILTDLGNARNTINVLTSHVVIACGMGAGTASEIALALKSGKHVILIEQEETSKTFFRQLNQDLVHTASSPQEAVRMIKTLLNT